MAGQIQRQPPHPLRPWRAIRGRAITANLTSTKHLKKFTIATID